MVKHALVALLGLAGLMGPATACDCGRAESAAAQAAGATVIFKGTARKTVHSDEEGSDTVYTIFAVTEALKGDPGAEAYISHPAVVDMNCGVDFADGEDALVFAYAETPEMPLSTNQCAMPQFSEDEIRAALKNETKSTP